ncbi:MAG TPA: hypothetical protein VHN99_10720 [Deinococcales bacterium]|nr:hypothetical protein [Deinococcales bacterium]
MRAPRRTNARLPARERPRGVPGLPPRRRRRFLPGERLRVSGTLSTVTILLALVAAVFALAWAETWVEMFVLPAAVAVGLVALGLRERGKRG